MPLEAKAFVNPRSKSLRSYDLQFSPPILARTTLLNFKKDGKILNLPLYALSELGRFVARPLTGEPGWKNGVNGVGMVRVAPGGPKAIFPLFQRKKAQSQAFLFVFRALFFIFFQI